ncbi:MAG: phosphoribosylformylglycinamidine synthase subunit PurL [Caldiserica bacterium]|nr:MAG: phosphoribosylformylglycinamidine synthase subunit PurL [Caldisericota bacterium]
MYQDSCQYFNTGLLHKMEKVRKINILDADDEELMEISRRNLLSLDLKEMKAIQSYFKKVGRNPTDCEIETIAQTWSEHCIHKTFKAEIEYIEEDEGRVKKEKVRLLDEIMKTTKRLNKKWCISVFRDNAGIIEFTDKYGVAFKVETHNHPSALEPYGGAGTGIGGVIRDILGVGLGAKPILNTDIFCFGNLNTPYEKLPEGILHPRRIFKGVVSGVRDYGNRMGIPTGNGAIIFDNGYLYNCLVFCGTVGLIPKEKSFKEVKEGDFIVVVGGRTGRDGIHGATFSSASLEKDIPTSVVQIGNPIVEKKLLDVLLVARDRNLYNSITDCGAGGLSSAIGEMGKELGAEVYLEKVPLKYRGLSPWEIWVSESQERMVLSVPPDKVKPLLNLFKSEDVEATVIGRFVKTGYLKIYHRGKIVADLSMEFLHCGIPKRKLKAYFRIKRESKERKRKVNFEKMVLKLLRDPNIASKEVVIRQYDHEVIGQTILKPLVGKENDGPSDGVVLKPLYDEWKGIVVSCGINPFYGKIDPYFMAGCCIEESLRNLVCAGGNPTKVAILDNFCWGDVSDEKQLGLLVRTVKGCRDFAMKYKVPFISGKDSLNNFFTDEKGRKISIPGTLLISAIGIIEDVRNSVSSDFKREGNPVYLCGKTYKEFGGSHYYKLLNIQGGEVPKPRPEEAMEIMKKLHRAMRNGWIEACHDCSEGGFIVALSEMVIGGKMGVEIDTEKIICEDENLETRLFSESQGRFIIEVKKEYEENFEDLMKGSEFSKIGKVIENPVMKIKKGRKTLFEIGYKKLKNSWKGSIKW